jgi:hypothetical protein
MGIGDSITLVSCLAGLMMALPALVIFLNLAFFNTSDRATQRLARGAYTPFFAGFIPIIVLGIPGAILAAIGSIFQLVGGLLLVGVVIIGFMGLGVVARLIGVRLAELNDLNVSPLVQTLTGAFVLAFAIAFPLVGWFIVFPVAMLIGAGSITLVMMGRILPRRRQRTVPVYQVPVDMPEAVEMG